MAVRRLWCYILIVAVLGTHAHLVAGAQQNTADTTAQPVQQQDWEQQEQLLDQISASQSASSPPPLATQLTQEQGELDMLEQKQNSIALGVQGVHTPSKPKAKTAAKATPARKTPSVGGSTGLKQLEAAGSLNGGMAEPHRASTTKGTKTTTAQAKKA